MSDAEEKNDKRAGKEEDLPTASFNGSAPGGQIGPFRIERELECGAVVVHWTNRSIRSFDFLNITGYSTGVLGKRGY